MDAAHPLVVIPTYNEADNIGSLVAEILGLSPAFHILVVDDSSPDQTASRVQSLIDSTYKDRLFLLSRPQKDGLGSAYRAGFQWALEKTYDPICQMDADFSHDPQDLLRMIATINEVDICIGSRYIPGGTIEGWSAHRTLLSRLANIFATTVTGLPIRDLTGGFKCFRKSALNRINLSKIRETGYTFQIEMNARAVNKNLSVREIPITFRERREGQSKISSLLVSLQTIALVILIGLKRLFT